MRKSTDGNEPLIRRLENSGPGKAIYYIGLAAGAAAALGGTAVLAYKWDEIRLELAAVLSAVDEPIETPPMEEQALDPALATETVPTTVEITPTVEAAPTKPVFPTGWELAPEVFSTGTAAQKEAAVKGTTPSSCAAYTFECKDGTFTGSSDQFVNVTGCPKPLIDWTGWTAGTKVHVQTEGKEVYEKSMTAPPDLCPQIPDVNGRVIHYFAGAK